MKIITSLNNKPGISMLSIFGVDSCSLRRPQVDISLHPTMSKDTKFTDEWMDK